MLVDFELIEYSLLNEQEEILISETDLKKALGIAEHVNSRNSLISGELSPDGKKLLITITGINREQGYGTTDERLFIATTDLQSVEEIRLAPMQVLNSVMWSPDNSHVLVVDDGSRSIWTISTYEDDFGAVKRVASGDFAFWSADSQQVFYSRNVSSTWYVVDRDGGNTQQMVQYSDEGAGVIGAQSPSKDKLALQYWRGIAILDIAKPEPQFIKIDSAYPNTWSADGKHLALGRTSGRGVLWTFVPGQEEPVTTALPGYPYCGHSMDGKQLMLMQISATAEESTGAEMEGARDENGSITTSTHEATYLFFNPETEEVFSVMTFEYTSYGWANLGWAGPSRSCPVWIQTPNN